MFVYIYEQNKCFIYIHLQQRSLISHSFITKNKAKSCIYARMFFLLLLKNSKKAYKINQRQSHVVHNDNMLQIRNTDDPWYKDLVWHSIWTCMCAQQRWFNFSVCFKLNYCFCMSFCHILLWLCKNIKPMCSQSLSFAWTNIIWEYSSSVVFDIVVL